jgi:hypothetical protein
MITRPIRRPRSGPADLATRGEAILRGLSIQPHRASALLAARIQPDGRDPFCPQLRHGLTILLAAVDSGEAWLASAASGCLVGVGPGLTPLGDDYLGGTAVAVASLAGGARFGEPARERWLAALIPSDVSERTTPVSSRLLEMARIGHAPAPIHGVLDLTPHGRANLNRSLAELTAIGASTGRGWAAAIGATTLMLAARAADGGDPKTQPSGQEDGPR